MYTKSSIFTFMQVEKGRSIYAGIQKFVAFIMSVHIAEARLKKRASN